MTSWPATTGYLWRGKPDLDVLNAQIMAARVNNLPAGRGVRTHGDEAGYQQHRRRGEQPCAACKQGQNAAVAARARRRRARERQQDASQADRW